MVSGGTEPARLRGGMGLTLVTLLSEWIGVLGLRKRHFQGLIAADSITDYRDLTPSSLIFIYGERQF